jgi:hypothetical protein
MGAEFDFVLDCMDHFMELDQEFGNFCFVGFLLVSVVVIRRRLAFRFLLSCELVVDPESLTGSKRSKYKCSYHISLQFQLKVSNTVRNNKRCDQRAEIQ